MDGTLSPSRSLASPEILETLESLIETHDIIVVSGSHNKQMRVQLPELPIIQLGQNGNHAEHPVEGELWNDILTEEEKAPVFEHMKKMRELVTTEVPDEDDLIEDRGSQISFSLYGHHGDAAVKRTIDPDFSVRREMMKQIPFENELVEAKIAGSTSIDYFKKGRNKGYNVARLAAQYDWDLDECVYYGDALFPGGNDETVVGIIDTIEVKDPEDTLRRLRQLL